MKALKQTLLLRPADTGSFENWSKMKRMTALQLNYSFMARCFGQMPFVSVQTDNSCNFCVWQY